MLSRFGLSSIIAYTATGVVLGPVLGIAEASTEIQIFLGIGILVLFFLAGLDEIDIPGFVATFCGRYFVAAVLSVVVSLLVALIVTSDDLTALNVLILLAKILGFVVVTWVLSAKLLPPAILFLRRFIRVPELSFGLLLGGLFLVVVGAEEIGLHGTIGALLFGAALSGLPEGVRHDILPGMRSASEGLFVPGDHGAELRRRMGRAASSRLRGGRRWRGGGNRVDAKGAFGSGEGTDDEDAAGSAAHAGAACLSG